MNKRKIAMGPGAASIILIIVTLSLCMLAMLTLISAKNDSSLSVRSANMIEQVYSLNGESERTLAQLDEVLVRCLKDHPDEDGYYAAVEENLPDGMEIDEDHLVYWSQPLENRTLDCCVWLLPPGSDHRTEWISHLLIVEESEDDWEWN